MRQHLLGRGLDIGHDELEMEMLPRVRPARALIVRDALEAELDRVSVTEVDEVVVFIGRLPAGHLAVELRERRRVGAVDDDGSHAGRSRHADPYFGRRRVPDALSGSLSMSTAV